MIRYMPVRIRLTLFCKSILIFRGCSSFQTWIGGIFLLSLILGTPQQAAGGQRAKAKHTEAIPASEFSRLVREFSEPGGYFQSRNLASNETSYLHIVNKLTELRVSGGAYIGVGPEQNFTYIAKIRPNIAFIVDIRRQAVLEHLLYKAVFHRAKDRAEFLSFLFSRPLSETRSEARGSLLDLLNYIFHAPTTNERFSENLAAIRTSIEQDFKFPLSSEDMESLTSVYRAFWQSNLRIAYGYGFPTLGELILEKDLEGNEGNFLAGEQDYRFVRELQERNRVIPVVGDFAGRKALAAVASYLRGNGYTISAFYTSNVEEYLFQDEVFGNFVENIRRLPFSDRTVFIRSVKAFLGPHPAWVPGDNMITLLQKFPVFLEDYRQGLYPDYWSLVTTHYIAGSK